MGKKVRCLLMALPLALDCAASVVIGESFGATLSAKAWDAKLHNHPRWHRMADRIDGISWFGKDHCRIQYEREKHYQSVWKAWAADWRGETFTPPPNPIQPVQA